MSRSTEQAITVPGRYENIRAVCEFVGAGAEAVGLDEDMIFQIQLACDEAATNIIEHAYGGEEAGTITATYSVTDGAFTITLHDKGRSFDPASVPPPPPITTKITDTMTPEELETQLRVGGLGLHLIRQLMDEVYFSSDQKRGNTLVMVKRLQGDDTT